MTDVTVSAKKKHSLDPNGQTSMLRPNCNTAEAESNTVLLKKGKNKVGEESVNEVLSHFTPAKELVEGEVPGRKEGQFDLFFR